MISRISKLSSESMTLLIPIPISLPEVRGRHKVRQVHPPVPRRQPKPAVALLFLKVFHQRGNHETNDSRPVQNPSYDGSQSLVLARSQKKNSRRPPTTIAMTANWCFPALPEFKVSHIQHYTLDAHGKTNRIVAFARKFNPWDCESLFGKS